MPSYNAAKFIAASIQSVIGQTYRNWELLITDDCSKDDTVKIVEQFLEKDNRIKLFSTGKNSGPACARNKSLENATGKYIAFLDSDDIWVSNKLETQIQFMIEKNIAFSFSSYSTMKEDGTPTFFPNTPYYLVAVGRNGEGQWFAPTLYEFVVEQPVGPATVTLKVNQSTTSATISAIPNEFAVEFHFGLVGKATYDAFGAESLIQQIRNDGYPYYQASQSSWDNLTPNTEYVALGSALNAGNEWGETAVEIFSTDPDGLVETEADFNIYPNPAQSMISIKSALNGEAQVSIFDMTGRCVKEVTVENMNNATINVEDLNRFEDETTINFELLVNNGLVKKAKNAGLKVLGNGEVSKKLHVVANKFSESAIEKIKKAGGTIEVL